MKKLLRNSMRSARQTILPIAAVGLASILGVVIIGSSHAASGSGTMSLSPASGSYNVGDTVTVAVHENSGTTNAVDSSTGVASVNVVLNYPQADLQFVSFDASQSGFNSPGPTNSGGSGTVTYETNEAGAPLTNDQIVVKVNFKVLAAGTAAVTFNGASGLGTPNGNDTNPTFSNGSFTLKAPVTPPPPPPPAPTPTPATPPPSVSHAPATPVTTTSSSRAASASQKSVAVTPSGSSTPVTLPDNASAQVGAPLDIQPTQTADDPIVKAVYYLNGKQVATVTQPPYSYKLNTHNLLNGKYTLQTKIFYTSGKVSLTSSHLAVKNPPSIKQFLLELKHYAWIFILLVLVIAIAIYFRFLRGRIGFWPHRGSGGSTSDTPPVDPDNHIQTFLGGPVAQVIAPGSQPATIPSTNMPSIKINNIQLGKAKNPQPGTVVSPDENRA